MYQWHEFMDSENAQWHFHWTPAEDLSIDLPRADHSWPQQYFMWRGFQLPVFRTREKFEEFYEHCQVTLGIIHGQNFFDVQYLHFPFDQPHVYEWAHNLLAFPKHTQHGLRSITLIDSWGKGKGKGTISPY